MDGRIFSVKQFSIENSEFTILETGNSSRPYMDIFSYTPIPDNELPFTINLEQVEALEFNELSYGKTALFIVGSAAIAACIFVAYFVTTEGAID